MFGSEYSQVIQEDKQQYRRAEIAQQENEDFPDAERQVPVVGDLCFEHFAVEPPADKYAGKESACREQDVGRQIVQRIEKVQPADFPASTPSDSDAKAANTIVAPVVAHAAALRLRCHSSCM